MTSTSRSTERLLALFGEAAGDGSFISLTCSRPTRSSPEIPPRIVVRPFTSRQQREFQWIQSFADRQTHENLSAEASVQRLAELAGPSYRHVHLFTTRQDVTVRISRGGDCRVSTSPPTKAPALETHDRPKRHLLPAGQPCPFLEALGVMTAHGHVRSARQQKFRQINRFLEFVEDVYPELPAEGPLQVVDFGCGLSYLTFAVQHLLASVHGRAVQILGVDRNRRVIDRARALARELSLTGLEFRVGEIDEPLGLTQVNLAVSLHACDTATDAALAQAISLKADVILAAPCCQHEVAPQLCGAAVSLLTEHGILRERLGALVTDALRAALLERAAYRTRVIEFVETEHTPKNLLLRAVRRRQPVDVGDWDRRIHSLKALLGVEQLALERLLREEPDDARQAREVDPCLNPDDRAG
jgi:SAM-dependent methyltransferase